MKTIAFAGSNSSKSINQKLINYASTQVDSAEIIYLANYNIPMYSMDIEEDKGIPKTVKET